MTMLSPLRLSGPQVFWRCHLRGGGGGSGNDAGGDADDDAVDHDGADEVSCGLLSVQVATKPIGHDGSVSMIP